MSRLVNEKGEPIDFDSMICKPSDFEINRELVINLDELSDGIFVIKDGEKKPFEDYIKYDVLGLNPDISAKIECPNCGKGYVVREGEK